MLKGCSIAPVLFAAALSACASSPEPFEPEARLAVLVVESGSLDRFTAAAKAERPIVWTGVSTSFQFAADDDPTECALRVAYAYEVAPGRFEPPSRPFPMRGVRSAPTALADAYETALRAAGVRRVNRSLLFRFGWGDELRFPAGIFELPGFRATPAEVRDAGRQFVLISSGIYGYVPPSLTSAEGRSVSFPPPNPAPAAAVMDARVTVFGPYRIEIAANGSAGLVPSEAPTEPIVAALSRATGAPPKTIVRAAPDVGRVERCPPPTEVGPRAREILAAPGG